MALASITVDASSLARAADALAQQGRRLDAELDLVVRRRLADARDDFRAHTPRSVPQPGARPHPHMADLWQSSPFGPASGGVFNQAPYTPFLYEPTGPHDIAPTQASALHFYAGGSEVFTGHVHHPGTQPSAPLLEALGRQIEGAEDDLEALGVRVVTDVAAHIGLP